MLLVGYGSGYIYMNIFGRYPYGVIHLAQVAKDDFGEYNVLDIKLSDDFSVMQVLYIDRYSNNVLLSLINTSVLSAYAEEMFIVANKHVQIVQMLSYLDQTMTSITEAWEHILLEIDTKLAFYAASVPDGGVSADMLELLMLGNYGFYYIFRTTDDHCGAASSRLRRKVQVRFPLCNNLQLLIPGMGS